MTTPNRKPRVYIIGPYRLGDTALNVRAACLIWGDLWRSGLVTPICPHLTHFQHLIEPMGHDQWLAWCLEMLDVVDAAVRFPGESRGAEVELARCDELKIPVFWPVSACLEWASVQSFGAAPCPSRT